MWNSLNELDHSDACFLKCSGFKEFFAYGKRLDISAQQTDDVKSAETKDACWLHQILPAPNGG